MKLGFRRLSRLQQMVALVSVAALVGACASVATSVTSKEWQSRATVPSQGIVKETDGKRVQERYAFFAPSGIGSTSFDKWPNFATGSPAYPPPQTVQMPTGIKGDPVKGLALIKLPAKGPCIGCHVIPDKTAWPLGNVGPDLRAIGSRGVTDAFLYQVIYDPRVFYGPDTPMAPFGTSGMWTPEEIVHAVAYLQSLKGDPPGKPEQVTDDKQWDPRTRDLVRPAYGDALDVTANPGLSMAESIAVPMWSKAGPKGQSCAGCHGAIGSPAGPRTIGTIKSMEGVAVRYPKWFGQHQRMMSVEDFLAVHAPETTGQDLPSQGDANMSMSILVKMQSYGMPYAIDLKDRNVQAAVKRGEELFNRRVGQRGQSCANCHTERGGGHKFLGGRFLANVEKDAMVNHPYFRTAWQRLIDIRIRMQWCMTPLLTNMLPGDAPEYADLETFLISKQTQRGDKMLVPRLSH